MMTSICILAASLFTINEAVVDMREEPSREARIASQALFSEEVTVLKFSDNWVLINTPDGYSGWVNLESLINLTDAYNAQIKTKRLKTHIYGVKDTEWGPIKSLPYGSRLSVLDDTDARWMKIALLDGRECYVQKGDVGSLEPQLLNKSALPQFSQKFLGLPYTWGGRSSFGYDCSGLVQMLYSQIGVDLPRDSKQQIADPRFQSIEIDELDVGDLIFFGKAADKIRHVGLYIGDGQFVHSTALENQPWIRISNLTDFQWSGAVDAVYPYRAARKLK